MRVLLTGQVGLDKGDYLRGVKGIAQQRGKDIYHVTLGQKMIEMYPSKIDDKTILNLPKGELDLLRRHAWKDIVVDAKSRKADEVYVLNSHAVFRWHHGLFPAIDLDLIMDFAPDIVVTLIDDVDKIKERLKNRGTDIFELWELLAWREEEVWLSKFLTESLKKLRYPQEIGYFILPRAQGPELLLRLLTETTKPKVYMSFAATGLPKEKKEEVESFKERVSAKFIAFDPLALQERSVITAAYSLAKEIAAEFTAMQDLIQGSSRKVKEQRGRWLPFWDDWSALGLAELDVGKTSLLGRQVISILEAVDSQIISRDFLLIEQSDFVLMYIRTSEDGVPQISAGSQSEMVYAYSHGKPVYVVCPGGKRQLSPWVTEFSEVFATLPEAFEFLSMQYPENVNT